MPKGKRVKNSELTQFRSGDEAVQNGKKGGVASGAARRNKPKFRELVNVMAYGKVLDEEAKETLALAGYTEEQMVNLTSVVSGLYNQAQKGDTKAIEMLLNVIEGGDSDEEQVYELPARVIGSAFVDLNRRIEPNKTYDLEGGRGGLKSSFWSLKIIELIKNNPQMHACVVRKVAGTLRDSVYAQIKWAIHELGFDDEFTFRVSPLEIVYKKTGQTIYFRGVDDPIKLKSIKPPFGYIGILWKEEKDQLAGAAEERSINQSILRGGPESYDFGSYNPPRSKSHWVNKEALVPNENKFVYKATYLQAPQEWLGQKFIDDAEHLKKTNPAAYEHEYLGIPNGEGGNVFEYVEIRKIKDEEIEKFDRIYQGVDFGWYPDQFAFLRTYYDSAREKIYLLDELYVNKWSNEQTAAWIKEQGYDDYNIVCDSAEPKSVNDYRDAGLPARGAVKGPGSVDYGFKFLQRRTLVIDPERTPNAYKEIMEYEYDRDKDGNVISGYPDENDHAISALRYAYEPVFNRRNNSA